MRKLRFYRDIVAYLGGKEDMGRRAMGAGVTLKTLRLSLNPGPKLEEVVGNVADARIQSLRRRLELSRVVGLDMLDKVLYRGLVATKD